VTEKPIGFEPDQLPVAAELIEECLEEASRTGCHWLQLLVEKHYLSEEELLRWFSHTLHMPFRTGVKPDSLSDDFVDKIPVHFARRFCVVGLGTSNAVMDVATASPIDLYPLDDVASILGVEVRPVLVPRSEIVALINAAYQKKTDLVEEIIEEIDFSDDQAVSAVDSADVSEDLLDSAHKAPVVRLINMFLFEALKLGASDVHIQPYEDKVQVRVRVDGILYDTFTPPKSLQEALVSRVKVMGKMDIAEKRLPQDGRTTVRIGGREVDLRISSLPSCYGERIVMRLLDKSARLYELSDLGLDEDRLRLFERLISYTHGIIFVTGPTGCGKTTTLYAALEKLNAQEKNIITLEDPIEYHLRGISQTQVSYRKGLTFATGLRSVLRQDPDIIMVGEVRDEETARMAIQSALTGHLVFSTLHTNDSAGAITRMLDIGAEPYLVSSSVIAVLAQRLVRRVCPACAQPCDVPEDSLRALGLTPDKVTDARFSRGAGCSDCMNTGYRGRIGVFELLVVDADVRSQAMQRRGADEIKRLAIEHGLETLRMDGARKVARGITTTEEVLRVTQVDVF